MNCPGEKQLPSFSSETKKMLILPTLFLIEKAEFFQKTQLQGCLKQLN